MRYPRPTRRKLTSGKAVKAERRAILADSLVANRGAHEIKEEHEAAESKYRLDDAADEGIELEESPQRPTRGPGRANHFSADQNGHSYEGRDMEPVDFLRFSQNTNCSISRA